MAQAFEEGSGAGGVFIVEQFQADPARRAVDGDEQIGPDALIGHLRQVLRICGVVRAFLCRRISIGSGPR